MRVRSVRAIAAVITASFFGCVPVQAQTSPLGTESPISPYTAPGTPASSYALSGIDNVNLLNGNLVIQIPVTTIGGGAKVSLPITVPLQTQWTVDYYGSGGFAASGHAPGPQLGWDFSAGYLSQVAQSTNPNYCYDNVHNEYVGSGPYVTYILWHAPNGTQVILVDTAFNGQPQGSAGQCFGQLADRGRTFRSVDGSNVLFVAASDVFDSYGDGDYGVTGTLYFKDGTQYAFPHSASTATQIRDRNGNYISLNESVNAQTGFVTIAITDSANRQATILANENPQPPNDTITYAGNSGYNNGTRQITINYSLLQNALAVNQSLQTYASLFPELSGSSSTNFNPSVISSIVLADNTSYSFRYDSYGEVVGMTLPTGGVYNYTYGAGCTGSPQGADAACYADGVISLGNYNYIIYRRVTERDELSDGVNISGKTIFSATPAQNVDPNNSGVPGTTVTLTRKDGSNNVLRTETHLFYGDPTESYPVPATSSFYPAWIAGLEFKSTISSPQQTQQRFYTQRPWGSSDNTGHEWYSTSSTSSPAHDPQVCFTGTTNDTGMFSAVQYAYDQYNNPVNMWEFDYGVSSMPSACPASPSTFTRTTTQTFTPSGAYTNLNITNLPNYKVVADGHGNVGLWQQWLYDQTGVTGDAGIVQHDETNYGTGFTTRGNPTTIQQYNYQQAAWSTTTVAYDEAGNAITITDPNGHASHVGYTSATNFSLPSSTSNALNQSTSTQYDANGYVRTSTKDLDGNTTTYKNADPLDRLTEVDLPNGGVFTYTYNSPVDTTVAQKQTASVNGKTETLYDGLGRVQEQRTYETGSQYISVFTKYDGLGRVSSVSNPTRPGDGLGYTTVTSYDGLGRATQVQGQDGLTRSTSYYGNTATVTDEAAKSKKLTYDALSRLTKVEEDPYGSDLSTTYTYDSMDNLRTVAQSGQTRTFGYDSQQNLTSAANPESGTVTYSYDLKQNRKTRVDARNITTTYGYDNLDRLISVSYNDGQTPSVTYGYDASGVTNSIGNLTSVVSSASTTNFTNFDAVGNVLASNQQTAGNTYGFSYGYDFASNLTSETYPSGRAMTFVYDQANRTTQVSTGAKNYASNFTYAPHGGYTQYAMGNNLYRAFGYNQRLQPSSIQDLVNNNSSNTLLSLSLNWYNSGNTGNNGNLQSVTQSNGGPGYGQFLSFQQTYGYDNVNRLSQIYENPPGNASPYWYRTFNYDNFGNMWVSATSGLAAPALTPQSGSAFNSTTNRLATGSYDAAGNQTVFSNFTAAYDAENRQTTVTDGTSGNQMTYRYDGNGQRVIKGNTVYVYDAFGLLVAQYNNFPVSSVTCTTCYLSADHLGSTRLVTDGSANVVARHDHMPFGEELSSGVSGRTAQWDGQDGVTQKFTGEERDAETGLDFFQARYYSSAIGRFMSPDPANAGADPSNPQSWNGYAYVLDSPLIGVDPDGTDPYQGSGDDPCDGDPYCGWGDPWFPIGFPSDPGPSQPPPPPYTPPMTPIPNTTGVYGQGGGFLQAAPLAWPDAIGACALNPIPCVAGGVAGIGAYIVYKLSPPGPFRTNGGATYSGPRIIIQRPVITLKSLPPTGKPKNSPTGTMPIDKVTPKLSTGKIHQIKTEIGAGPRDWVGVAPNGDIITSDPSGNAINHGPWEP